MKGRPELDVFVTPVALYDPWCEPSVSQHAIAAISAHQGYFVNFEDGLAACRNAWPYL